MISAEVKSQIRRLFYVSHFPMNAIAEALGLHRDTVSRALELDRKRRKTLPSELDRFDQKIRETLEIYPKLHGSRIYGMLKEQGYTGSLRQVQRRIGTIRPSYQECRWSR